MMTFEQAISGREDEAQRFDIVLLDVRFWSFAGAQDEGQVLVARELGPEVHDIFEEMLAARFPLQSVIPVVAFSWSDDASMTANNSSGFNPRLIAGGSRPSHHSTGRAIDINPVLNPYIKGEIVLPPSATYNYQRPGTLTPDSIPVRAFEARGWTWGGRWQTRLDYHHFEKT
jgi:hypothetical protein